MLNINYTIISGALPIQVELKSGATLTATNNHAAFGSYLFTGITNGSYTIIFTDAQNCSGSTDITYPVPTTTTTSTTAVSGTTTTTTTLTGGTTTTTTTVLSEICYVHGTYADGNFYFSNSQVLGLPYSAITLNFWFISENAAHEAYWDAYTNLQNNSGETIYTTIKKGSEIVNVIQGGLVDGDTFYNSLQNFTVIYYADGNYMSGETYCISFSTTQPCVPSSIDTSFIVGTGFYGLDVNDIYIQPDNKLLVGGDFTSYSGQTYNKLIRLNSDGSIDTSFVIGDGFDNTITTIDLQSDGKILVGGLFTSYSGQSYDMIIRLNSGGTIDTSFTVGSGFINGVQIIKVQDDGKILVGGFFSEYDSELYSRIIRLNSDGSIDTSFVIGDGFSTQPVNDIKIQDDGKILVGGLFRTYQNQSYSGIIRLNSGGTIDTSFIIGDGFSLDEVNIITIQDDGKILVGGYFSSYSGQTYNSIIRLNSDGSIDTSFVIGNGFNIRVNDIKIDCDNKILVVGSFTSYSGQTYKRIIRLNSDGSIDTSFSVNDGFNNMVNSIEVLNDKIYVCGRFTSYYGQSYNRIIRLLNCC